MMAHHGFLSGRLLARRSDDRATIAGFALRSRADAAEMFRPRLTSSHASPCCRGLVMKAPAKLDVDFAWIVKVESAERQAVVEQDSPVRHVQRR
jgi:hypothetical protein